MGGGIIIPEKCVVERLGPAPEKKLKKRLPKH